MGKRTCLLVGSLVLLLASTGVAHAVPIVYDISGQFSFGDNSLEDFTGSFVLSDPEITLLHESSSLGAQRDRYTVSDFTLSSASYSLTQSGSGTLVTFWGRDRDDRGVYLLNQIDSALSIATPAGWIDSPIFSFPEVWLGDPGRQPQGFSEDRLFVLVEGNTPPDLSRPRRLLNVTAVNTGRVARVPEPSALLLCGLGIAGCALFRRRALQ